MTAEPAVCPRCKRAVPGLVLADGELRVREAGTIITAYWCAGCKSVIHWGKLIKEKR